MVKTYCSYDIRLIQTQIDHPFLQPEGQNLTLSQLTMYVEERLKNVMPL
ncbi:hypothetical protein SEPB62_04930 [Salmonella enterica subsp. enterica serovar Paratyphi B str. SARA62]|nr:hypothetical protein SEPB62_04930 [Salmonella enterica subsp. enterica serovar Paratyphi B str. SARA62]ESF87924.1 hypothetical protein SEEPB585_21470 [Salmonella enterica subsp. enterica serovar Paratyphi B str. ATCC BAA-1585]